MSILGIIIFIVIGFVAGLIARAIVPGRQKLGLGMTAVLGIAGSLMGGLFVSLLGRGDGFEPLGFLGSVVGAVILLWGYVAVTRRRTVAP
jgi:uncharacterized membrane protein YeaQ/YmgE (transglycosylase-associated protein family)